MYQKTCLKCREIVNLGKPDPCLGYLPGVAHACCGHGNINMAFVNGFDGCKPDECITEENLSEIKYKKGYWVKRGKEALEYMQKLKKK